MSFVSPLALIIDSASNHTQALQTLAESAGFKCELSTDDMLPADVSPSIVFMCLDNPGLETLEVISNPALNNATEIIVMASEDDQVSVRRVISEDATYFFCKPVDKEFLKP